MTALPHQLVWQARQIAEAHGLRVVPVTDIKCVKGDRVQVKAYVIYRCDGSRIRKCRQPGALLKAVRTAAGVTG